MGVVDKILQRVGTRVIIFELGIIGDYPCSWIIGVHQTADVNRLDVGEVSKDPRASGAAGLESGGHESQAQRDKGDIALRKCPPFSVVTLPPVQLTTNHKGAATSTCFVDWKGEPDNGRGDRLIQGSFALWVVEDVVEKEKRRVVAGVHDRADLNRQADGGRAAFH